MDALIKFNDSTLQGKKVITKQDIYNVLPSDIKGKVAHISLRIDRNQVYWMIYIKGDAGYRYELFSGELVYDGYLFMRYYNRILVAQRAKFLRKEKKIHEQTHKWWSEFICLRHKMILLNERKEYWMKDDNGEDGVSTETKWFRYVD